MTTISFWDVTSGRTAPPRPALAGVRDADVCVVGAGYTGLWTAYEIKRADPSQEVVVLEARTVGFGASGRNGGWVVGELAGDRDRWAARSGRDAVVALGQAIRDTVDEVGEVVAREGIECGLRKGGSIHVAQTALELEEVRARVAHDRAWGWSDDDNQLLDARAAAERVAVKGVVGARYTPCCARVQPAQLVHGLAEAAERLGVTIHEQSPVTGIAPGRATTPQGQVDARHVVRATEGYTADLPGHHRDLLPMTSSMLVTEPLDAATWEAIRWNDAETLLDGRHRYIYAQRTVDGRIAIGGRGVPYRFGSKTDREGPVPQRTVTELRARLGQLFAPLRSVRIDAAWHGVLGVPRDWAPAVGLDRTTGLAHAGGYVGEGVAAANLAGRTLKDLILGIDSDLTRLPWVGPFARPWEPEPLRFAGVHAVYGLYRRADEREARTGRPSLAAKLAGIIAGR
ncbi:MAG TPA: FAD-binding oxidoreductase [Baekduia sp.]|uniref:NAD(P)/FAD-dependent oxidoreductase n=1 Tax=Baekduia sp. TaxID=2600305 RepID=UPI002D775920|nr:FAD-binding oxidoreductase [Baekduia sp.]HET6510261.1 FAD-binding oxidoreductase [Baekduia sp.]